jgi:hypothetical protein
MYSWVRINDEERFVSKEKEEEKTPIQTRKREFIYFKLQSSRGDETVNVNKTKPRVATANSKEWAKRAVSSVYSLYSDAR